MDKELGKIRKKYTSDKSLSGVLSLFSSILMVLLFLCLARSVFFVVLLSVHLSLSLMSACVCGFITLSPTACNVLWTAIPMRCRRLMWADACLPKPTKLSLSVFELCKNLVSFFSVLSLTASSLTYFYQNFFTTACPFLPACSL